MLAILLPNEAHNAIVRRLSCLVPTLEYRETLGHHHGPVHGAPKLLQLSDAAAGSQQPHFTQVPR